jgi:hypothetical protein
MKGNNGEAALALGRNYRGDDSGCWGTPPDVLADALELFGHRRYSVDLAAQLETAVTRFTGGYPRLYFGPDHVDPERRDVMRANLSAILRDSAGGVCWLNPPYATWSMFVERVILLAAYDIPTHVLIFARTDTVGWHHAVKHANRVAFRRGRIRFVDPSTGAPSGTAPAPSALLAFGPVTEYGTGHRTTRSGAEWWTVPGGSAA